MQKSQYFALLIKRTVRRLFFQLSILAGLTIAILFLGQKPAQMQTISDDSDSPTVSTKAKNPALTEKRYPQTTKSDSEKNVILANYCTPVITESEGNLFPGGLNSFEVASGPGTVMINPVDDGTGLQSLTVVSVNNANVVVPAFTPGTYDQILINFAPYQTGYAVEFTLRAASTFHAVDINVRCAEICTPSTTVTEGDLNPGGIIYFNAEGRPGRVVVFCLRFDLGIKTLTVVGEPVNAVVDIPPFAPFTFDPLEVTFTPIDPNLPIDFRLRAAGANYAVNIRARCAGQ